MKHLVSMETVTDEAGSLYYEISVIAVAQHVYICIQ